MRRLRGTLLAAFALFAIACGRGGAAKSDHRERDTSRDAGCKEAERPHAYFYAAANRTDYAPDDPFKDGCALLVADHLFCCPPASKPTDR